MHVGCEMYRRKMVGQQKLEIPYNIELDPSNRWVKASAIMPWEKIEEQYDENFVSGSGQIPLTSRLAFGALYIQARLSLTDEETVAQIQENPSMQFFCGFDEYTTEKPFDASMMVHFRKRITAEMMKRISEEAFAAEAKKAISCEKDDDDKDKNDNTNDSSDDESHEENTQKPKGTLLLDATCCPSDIHYPTDIGLLNQARELTEQMIDVLHKINVEATKPRTYREVARQAFLSYAKKRKHTKMEIRNAIRKQLQYLRRNLDSIDK
jgi:hypothetical protein